jgi:hypothetical protein
MTAAHLSCWFKFVRYHEAVGLALMSASHAREAAHHFSTAAVALARATALSEASDWEQSRQLALLMAACAALVPHMPLHVDRLMQLVTRLSVSPSHPLPPLKFRLCEPVRSRPKGGRRPLFTPFVAAAAAVEGDKEGEWTTFIESAGLDAAVALLASTNNVGAKLYRAERLVAWMRDNGVVMPLL